MTDQNRINTSSSRKLAACFQPEQALEIRNELEKAFENIFLMPTAITIAAVYVDKEDLAIKALKIPSDTHDPAFPLHLRIYLNESAPLSRLKDFKKIIHHAGIPANTYWNNSN